MGKTFEFNGSIYREIATLEEAEAFRGHVITCYDGNGVTYETIHKITVFDNGSIKLNKRHTNFLLTKCKVLDEPVGLYVGVAGIKLPEVNHSTVQDLYVYELFGMTKMEAKIRQYIFEKGWTDRLAWDGDIWHHYIFILMGSDKWCYGKTLECRTQKFYINTEENAKFIADELNKSGIKF